MPKLILLVGPPGSGKSTYAKSVKSDAVYVNQDSQGKLGHMCIFADALGEGKNIIVDRMNFNKVQRLGYLEQARKKGYETEIHVFHEPYIVCLGRALARKDHETIKDERAATAAIGFFFKNYERVEDYEATKVYRHYPEGQKPSAIICDLDGTLADCTHRRHHVRVPEGKKKNWPAFFAGIKDDVVNKWCIDILRSMADSHKIVYCSGRSENEREATVTWLRKHKLDAFWDPTFEKTLHSDLYMRSGGDSRQDAIVKEIILDFEILTRYTPFFMIDDRQQVVDMWRKRGYTCLQCDVGDF